MSERHVDFTPSFVKHVTPAGTTDCKPDKTGRVEIPDLRVRGLELRITKLGLKTFTFSYKLKRNGKYQQRRITLGRWPTMGVKDARDAALALRDELNAGVDPSEPRGDTFEKTCELYIERSLRGRVKYPHLWRGNVYRHAIPKWRDRPIGEISRGDVHQLLDETKLVGVGAARELRKHLHSFFAWALDRELVKTNPAHRLRRDDLAPAQNVRRPLADAQIRELWNLPVRTAPQLRLLLLTGCRKGELGLSLWSEYDFEARTFTIPASRHKSKREVAVPLSDAALDILADVARNSVLGLPLNGTIDEVLAAAARQGGFVFGNKNSGGYLTNERLAPAQRRLKWRLRPHDLRATAASRLSQLGVAPHVVSAVLGHSQGGLFSVYSRYAYLDEKRQALQDLAQHLLEITK